jgi:hypothetical protein
MSLDELNPQCSRGCGRTMDDCYESEDGGECTGGEVFQENQRLKSELERVNRELADMQADAGDRYVKQLVEETRIRSLEIRNGKFELDMEAARELTAHFVAAARTMLGDAPNYAETKVEFMVKVAESPDFYTLVVQRHGPGRLTPHEARLKAEAEVERLNAMLAEAQQTLLELKPERQAEYRLITWDYTEQPDFEAISSAFTELSRGGTTYGYNVEDTGCDEYAVIISTVPLDKTGVQSVFEELWSRRADSPCAGCGAQFSAEDLIHTCRDGDRCASCISDSSVEIAPDCCGTPAVPNA